MLLQIGASAVTNQGISYYYKLGQTHYKLGVILKLGATITNRFATTFLKLYRNLALLDDIRVQSFQAALESDSEKLYDSLEKHGIKKFLLVII